MYKVTVNDEAFSLQPLKTYKQQIQTVSVGLKSGSPPPCTKLWNILGHVLDIDEFQGHGFELVVGVAHDASMPLNHVGLHVRVGDQNH